MPRTEIDPQLPYIQIHRSVGPKAAQLAPVLALSYQHVRGAMDILWESLADRRVLAGKVAVILTDTEARARLRMAFGQEVDPGLLALAGFFESAVDGWRVRGMSRYTNAEARRLKRACGDPEPTQGGSSGVPSAPSGGTAGVPREVHGGTTGVPEEHPDPAKARGERRDVRDERQEARADSGEPAAPPAGPLVFEPPDTPPEAWSGHDFERWFQCRRQAAGLPAERQRPNGRALSAWWSAALGTPGIDVQVLKGAVYTFGKDKHWEHATPPFPFRAFMSQWDKYAAAEVARASGG